MFFSRWGTVRDGRHSSSPPHSWGASPQLWTSLPCGRCTSPVGLGSHLCSQPTPEPLGAPSSATALLRPSRLRPVRPCPAVLLPSTPTLLLPCATCSPRFPRYPLPAQLFHSPRGGRGCAPRLLRRLRHGIRQAAGTAQSGWGRSGGAGRSGLTLTWERRPGPGPPPARSDRWDCPLARPSPALRRRRLAQVRVGLGRWVRAFAPGKAAGAVEK